MADRSPSEIGPTVTSRAAYRQRIWGALALTVLALATTAFVSVTLLLALEREARPYPALLIVLPGVAAWWGAVVLPREARLLKRPARRRELIGVVSDEPSHMLWPPFRRTEEKAWLYVTSEGEQDVAIPVWPSDARRVQQPMDALIRGHLVPGKHVVVEFGDEVFFPVGRVVDAGSLGRVGSGRLTGRWRWRWRMLGAWLATVAAMITISVLDDVETELPAFLVPVVILFFVAGFLALVGFA